MEGEILKGQGEQLEHPPQTTTAQYSVITQQGDCRFVKTILGRRVAEPS